MFFDFFVFFYFFGGSFSQYFAVVCGSTQYIVHPDVIDKVNRSIFHNYPENLDFGAILW